MKVSTKFNIDTTIRCPFRVIAADTLRDLVTLTFVFWPLSVVIHGGSRGQFIH